MSVFSTIIYLAVIGLILAAVIRVIWLGLKLGRDAYNYQTRYRFLHWYHKNSSKPLKPEYKSVLENYFEYYRKLSPANKVIFESRLQTFIDMKKFIVRTNELTLSPEMVVLISACAIQLSFGFPGIFFRHFHRILIYPDDYYSTITRKYHQGEVNRGGIIVLSWKNFLKGYADDSDGRNLGLHEMAHALLLENRIMNGEYEFIEPSALQTWDQLAAHELIRIRKGRSIFREYGASNKHELFAVATEVFFERPEDLKEYSTAWYNNMCSLLNQDVIRVTSGF